MSEHLPYFSDYREDLIISRIHNIHNNLNIEYCRYLVKCNRVVATHWDRFIAHKSEVHAQNAQDNDLSALANKRLPKTSTDFFGSE